MAARLSAYILVRTCMPDRWQVAFEHVDHSLHIETRQRGSLITVSSRIQADNDHAWHRSMHVLVV